MAEIVGTDGADSLSGTSLDDVIRGLAGNDTIFAGAGDDIIYAGDGQDRIYDGAGNDVCYAAGNLAIFVADLTDATSHDRFIGALGNLGVTESDLSYAEAQQSIVVNLARGRAIGAEIGVDRFVGINAVFGGDGDDIMRGDDAALAGFMGGGGDDTMSGGGGFDRLDGNDGNDLLRGGDGDDWLNGGSGSNRMLGGLGDDTINRFIELADNPTDSMFGGEGNDVLWGSFGNDTICGGNGDDLLLDYGGRNFMVGGAGADIFGFVGPRNPRLDIVRDFEDGIDKLRPDGSFTFDDVQEHGYDTARGLVIVFDQGTVLLRGVTLAQIDPGDFV